MGTDRLDRAAELHPTLSGNKNLADWQDLSFQWLVWLFATFPVVLLLAMVWVILEKASPAIQAFGLKFLWTEQWNVIEGIYGARAYIYGTLVTSTIALLLAVPIGICVAIVTTEDFLQPWLRSTIGFVVELLSAIPSVIIGLWGIFVLLNWLQPVQLFLFNNFKSIPLFSTAPFGSSILAAGIILAVMVLPTIAAVSREVLLVLPKELRSASMSLGATRWETILGVILPAAAPGVVGGVTLALGRALGETMAVTMVIGNTDKISISLLAPGNTIPSILALEFAEAGPGLHLGSLMYLALLLFGLTLVVNVIAEIIVQSFITPDDV